MFSTLLVRRLMDKERVMKVTQNEFKIEELLILIWIPRAKEFVRQK